MEIIFIKCKHINILNVGSQACPIFITQQPCSILIARVLIIRHCPKYLNHQERDIPTCEHN